MALRYAEPVEAAGASVATAGSGGGGGKLFAAAADRNREAIGDELERRVFAPLAPAAAAAPHDAAAAAAGDAAGGLSPRPRLRLRLRLRLLEVASGTGQHAAHVVGATAFAVAWQPSDVDAAARASVTARTAEMPAVASCSIILPPLAVDVLAPPTWAALGERASYDVMFAANLVHIAPPAVARDFFVLAAHAVRPGGMAALYGPFLVDGKPTTDSNAAFDARLKAMDSSYGLRDIAEVASNAAANGFRLLETVAMPANNFFLLFRHESATAAAGAGTA